MKLLNLFVDELGSAERNERRSSHYILGGCMVNERSREFLKIRSDQIKFKYWGNTKIVFHSREIGRKSGLFSILRNEEIFSQFQKDLFTFLNEGYYQLFIVVLDKRKALKLNWSTDKNYEETASLLVKNFILSLMATGSKGRLVAESATSKRDFIFHKAVSTYLSSGISSLNIGLEEVQNALTEVSFVTKKNFDIEEQIVDLLVYGAKIKILGKKVSDLSNYDRHIIKIMNKKLFKMDPKTGLRKKKYYSEIKRFGILP